MLPRSTPRRRRGCFFRLLASAIILIALLGGGIFWIVRVLQSSSQSTLATTNRNIVRLVATASAAQTITVNPNTVATVASIPTPSPTPTPSASTPTPISTPQSPCASPVPPQNGATVWMDGELTCYAVTAGVTSWHVFNKPGLSSYRPGTVIQLVVKESASKVVGVTDAGAVIVVTGTIAVQSIVVGPNTDELTITFSSSTPAGVYLS